MSEQILASQPQLHTPAYTRARKHRNRERVNTSLLLPDHRDSERHPVDETAAVAATHQPRRIRAARHAPRRFVASPAMVFLKQGRTAPRGRVAAQRFDVRSTVLGHAHIPAFTSGGPRGGAGRDAW